MANKVAQLIRKELKGFFPKQKFSVRTGGGSMSTAIRVNWQDGVAIDRVRQKLWKFEKIDRDERSGEILGGGNTFIFPERNVSDKNREKIAKKIQKKYGDGFAHQNDWQRKQFLQQRIWEKLNQTNF